MKNVIPHVDELTKIAADQHNEFVENCVETIIKKANEGNFSCQFDCNSSEFITMQIRFSIMGYTVESLGVRSLGGKMVALVSWQ